MQITSVYRPCVITWICQVISSLWMVAGSAGDFQTQWKIRCATICWRWHQEGLVWLSSTYIHLHMNWLKRTILCIILIKIWQQLAVTSFTNLYDNTLTWAFVQPKLQVWAVWLHLITESIYGMTQKLTWNLEERAKNLAVWVVLIMCWDKWGNFDHRMATVDAGLAEIPQYRAAISLLKLQPKNLFDSSIHNHFWLVDSWLGT